MMKIQAKLNAQMMSAGKYSQTMNEYKSLRTDEERVIYTLKVMSDYKILPELRGDEKDAQQSDKFREQGNKIFVSTPLDSNTCIEAFKWYTKSIAYAPYSSEQLALAYANRSAVLMKMHKYKECIGDVDRALSLPYPDNLRAKIYVRKVECLVALENPAVGEAVNEAQVCLQNLSLEDTNRIKLNKKLGSIKSSFSNKQNSTKPETKIEIPKLKSRNPEVPCASDAIAIKYNEQFGRHVVATRNLHPGELIIVEKPYAQMLSTVNLQTHCSNCLRVCWSNIPCDYCTCAMYCSDECKASDWKRYHDIECPVFPSLIKKEFSDLDLFSLRLAIKAVRDSNRMEDLRAELEEVDHSDAPRTKGFSKNGIFESDKCRSVLGLITNTEKRSVHDLLRRSLDSCFILYNVATTTAMFGQPLDKDLSALAKNADVTFVGGLIMRYQQIIPSNGHTLTEVHGLDVEKCGIGVLPFCSLINHSCYPNITRVSASECVINFVVRPIKNGEQILDNYGRHCAAIPKVTRQKELLQQYYFTCNCLPCVENWPLFYDVKSFKSLVKNAADLNKINNALRKLDAHILLATNGNVADKPHVVKDLLHMIQVLHDCVPLPCEEFDTVVETLKRVYDLMYENIFEIPKL